MTSIVSPPKDLLSRFIFISLALHGLFFGANLFLGNFYSKPQFAVESASSSIDIVIIEEEPELVIEEKVAELLVVKEEVLDAPVEEIIPEPIKEIKKEQPEEILKPVVINSQKGAIVEAKPDYLRNPAPVYPYRARQKGWEGTVFVKVVVSAEGLPLQIEIERSSSYEVLDEAAVKAIKKWQFRPAKLGSMSVESTVTVPVKFKIEG